MYGRITEEKMYGRITEEIRTIERKTQNVIIFRVYYDNKGLRKRSATFYR